EAQRVALARALVRHPRVVLLDEPLAALDRGRRAELRRMLHRLQRRHGVGFIHVTHDPQDALALADHVVVLAGGRVREQGPPAELYRRPRTMLGARLLGELTPVPGRCDAWLRPERLRVLEPGVERGRMTARVIRVALLGPQWEVELELDGQPGLAWCDRPPQGERCDLDWDPDDVLSFPS
ncbi:MAG: TOBE domain-containing protein, partial [Myxococcales bacterium]|nr:TOBE domain-containing protein [Myxococcales bacterium]